MPFLVNVYYQNVRSIVYKVDQVLPNILSSEYNILCLTETWLHSNISSSEYFPNNYIVYRSDRDFDKSNKSRGGGVLIAVENAFITTKMNLNIFDTTPTIDIVGCKLTNGSMNLYILNIYIPPDVTIYDFRLFFEILENLVINIDNIIVTGDFNVPNFGSNTTDCKHESILNFVYFTGSIQANNIRNCYDKTLDLVFYKTGTINVKKAELPIVNIDPYHPPLYITFEHYRVNSHKPFPFNSVLKGYNFKKANFICLYNEIFTTNWSFLHNLHDVDTMVDRFYVHLYRLLDAFVPKAKTVKSTFPPWYSQELKPKFKIKNYFHKKYKKTKLTYFYMLFSKVRKEINSLMHRDYNAYLHDVQENLRTNPKEFWKFIHNKKGHTTVPASVSYNNELFTKPNDIVNVFQEHFSKVFHSASDIDNIDTYNNKTYHTNQHPSIYVMEVTEEDIISATKNLKPNMCAGLDNVPAFLVKDCIRVLAEPLLLIFNMCLSKSTFPTAWKRSRICPVPKHPNSTDISDYRPISILSNFSKIFESVLYSHIYPKIKNIISFSQHGFMSKRSTTTNLTCMTQYLANALDSRKQVDVIYMDMSKAFDKILHPILLTKLDKTGFSRNLTRLFASYLLNRELVVVYNGFESSTFAQTSGVPQGSNLGPLLFILYVNSVTNCAVNSECLLYADDLKIFRIIESHVDSQLLQQDLTEINKWCATNGLSLNISKCKTVRYTRNANTIDFNYNLNDVVIDLAPSIRDLGVIFDSKLSFSHHIEHVTSTSLKTFGFIVRNTRPFININALKSLFCALVRSKLEYCSSVWSPQYLNKITCLENIQRRFLKLLHLKKFHHYPTRGTQQSVLLQTFLMQSLECRREINDISLLFKLTNNFIDCPSLLSQICYNVPPLRFRKSVAFKQPTPKTNLGQNSPLNRMCNLFNKVSNDCDIHNDKLKIVIKKFLAETEI